MEVKPRYKQTGVGFNLTASRLEQTEHSVGLWSDGPDCRLEVRRTGRAFARTERSGYTLMLAEQRKLPGDRAHSIITFSKLLSNKAAPKVKNR